MKRLYSFIVILAIGIAAGTAGSFWYYRPPETMSATAVVEPSAPAKAERKVLYYRNPMGLPDTSPVPKKDWMGMDYIPVYEARSRTTARPSRSASTRSSAAACGPKRSKRASIVRAGPRRRHGRCTTNPG